MANDIPMEGWRALERGDHLFPPAFQADTGEGQWVISVQGDRAGYDCLPCERLARLGDYAELEVQVSSPWNGEPDLGAMGVPPAIAGRMLSTVFHPLVAGRLTAAEIDILVETVSTAVRQSPNAGCPRGVQNWAGREIWHGTDHASALDICENGVNMDLSTLGYFGQAFYVAEKFEHARDSYAEANDADGAVVSGTIREGARILDLRNAEDSRAWDRIRDRVSHPGFAAIARRAGVDGVYDRSVGGLAIYNAAVIEDIEIVLAPESPRLDEDEAPGL